MPECTLRAFVPADGEWLREWYRVDQPGMQLVMGTLGVLRVDGHSTGGSGS